MMVKNTKFLIRVNFFKFLLWHPVTLHLYAYWAGCVVIDAITIKNVHISQQATKVLFISQNIEKKKIFSLCITHRIDVFNSDEINTFTNILKGISLL